MKEVKNYLVQAENAAKIMDRLRVDLLAQGFVETSPEVFERKNALGLPEEIRMATSAEQAMMKPGRVYLDTEASSYTTIKVEKDQG